MAQPLRVEVDWTRIAARGDPLWQDSFCLYGYLNPRADQILYIGKADYQTVRQRTHGRHKAELFEYLCDHCKSDELSIIHGQLLLEAGRRFSTQLLADVESLLIKRLQPPGNISSTCSRIYRPGLRVKCTGDWPHRRTGFHDWN